MNRLSPLRTVRNVVNNLWNLARELAQYCYKAWKSGLIKAYKASLLSTHLKNPLNFKRLLYHHDFPFTDIHDEKLEKLHRTSLGLHSLLPSQACYSYSILVVVHPAELSFLEVCLASILRQTAPTFEVLIGTTCQLPPSIEKMVIEAKERVQIVSTTHLNDLAKEAKGSFLLCVDTADWIRPDLLHRFEQTLRIFSDPENRVLYCNLNKMTAQDFFIPLSEIGRPEQLHFPYFFDFFQHEGIMIPKKLWEKIKGIDPSMKGAEFEDLILRLQLAGAKFQHIPFCLYAVRESKNVELSKPAFLKALQSYSQALNLNWSWQEGFHPRSVRALPPLNPKHTVQVIIPYKDQRALTLRCIEVLLEQRDVQFKITAIDNRSEDKSIADAIQAMGAEVISINEPFNYSRLNNLAVQKTQTAQECDLLLFLNNDVELDLGALAEMVRWIDQPEIGMVGIRLNFPDGTLQHGGVSLAYRGDKRMHWCHVERLLEFEEMDLTKKLAIFPAVTAACALVKKCDFLAVGGFDEIWYPIGYSDTHLAFKLGNRLGLKCLYTPYASGVHFESVSRKVSHEEYENSWWLHNLLIETREISHPK